MVWLGAPGRERIRDVLALLFMLPVYYLFFRQFLGPVIGGALVQEVGFRSMPAVRLSEIGTSMLLHRAISCICLTFNLRTYRTHSILRPLHL